MNITELNLMNYDITILSYSDINDASKIPARQFKIKFGAMSNPDMNKLMKDMTIMNAVRGQSANVAVQDAFEQLLTILALTNPGLDNK